MLINRIHHMDCFNGFSLLKDGCVDMILADMPYGMTQNKWDSTLPLDNFWEQVWRVLKPTGTAVFTACQPFTSALVMSQVSLFRHEWIWIKNRGSNFANTIREPMKEHESVLVFSRGKWLYNKQMQERTGGGSSRVKYSIESYTNSSNYGKMCEERVIRPEMRVPSSWQKFNTEVGLHPTQKPVALFEYLIKTYTNEMDLVLDPCCGSGTTAVACINTCRRYICFESDAVYSSVAVKRAADLENKIMLEAGLAV